MIISGIRKWTLLMRTCVVILAFGTIAFAKTAKVEGLIKSRQGDAMMIQTSSSPNVTVLLNEKTRIRELHGAFNAVRKDVSQDNLTPGLKIRIQGTYNEQRQVVAKTIKFRREGFRRCAGNSGRRIRNADTGPAEQGRISQAKRRLAGTE